MRYTIHINQEYHQVVYMVLRDPPPLQAPPLQLHFAAVQQRFLSADFSICGVTRI